MHVDRGCSSTTRTLFTPSLHHVHSPYTPCSHPVHALSNQAPREALPTVNGKAGYCLKAAATVCEPEPCDGENCSKVPYEVGAERAIQMPLRATWADELEVR